MGRFAAQLPTGASSSPTAGAEEIVDPFATNDLATREPQPRRLGCYRLFRQLGSGGMGVVYEAERDGATQRVALKTLRADGGASLTRFKQEFRVLAEIAHPNLVRLGELIITEPEPFFTMELIAGQPFHRYVQAGFDTAEAVPSLPFQPGRLRHAFGQLASGLNALHQAGFLHRDLKPTNVLVTDQGRTVILDFGLAVEMEGEVFRNSLHEFAGTPFYMAPEQAAGQSVTAAADWYSVGVMLFEALTGQLPFQSRTLEALQEEKRSTLRQPRELVPEVPEDLNLLCHQMLSPDPAARPSGAEILTRIGGETSRARSDSVWVGRHEQLQALAAAWQAAHSGTPQVVLISGRSGMGKTALVDHFLSGLRQQQQVVVLRGRCYENETVAYQGFDSAIDALSRYLQRLPTEKVERILPLETDALCQIFPVLSEIPAVAASRMRSRGHNDPLERRRRGRGALRELLCRLARWENLILFIDDLQWGGDDTAALFRELFNREEAPVAMAVGTFRSEEADTSRCLAQIRRAKLPLAEQQWLTQQLELQVDRLDDQEAQQLASELLRRAGIDDPELGQRIANEAEGDPLFIRVLARNIQDDAASAATTRWTLGKVLWKQISTLPGQERRAVEILATAGRPVDVSTLGQVARFEDDAPTVVRSLRVHRFIRQLSDPRDVEMYHDKIRETVVAHLSASRLQQYCLALATAIEQRAGTRDSEFLADLYRRAGERLRAGACYAEAADAAAEALAFSRAAQMYGWAIELLQPSGQRERELRTRYGDALANASRAADAAQQYLAAAELADDDQRTDLYQRAAHRLLTSGHIEAGVNALVTALQTVQLSWPHSTSTAVAGLLLRNSLLRMRGFRPNPRPRQLDRHRRLRLDACWSAAAGLSIVDPVRGAYFVAENLRLALDSGDPFYVSRALAAYIGHAAIGGSRSRGAVQRVLAVTRRIARHHDHPYLAGMLLIARGIAALLRGHWSRTLRCCDRAVRYLHDQRCHGVTWELDTARTFALWAIQYQGNMTELARRQPELLQFAKETDDLFASLNFGTQVMTHVQLAAGRDEEALYRLEEDRKLLSDGGFFVQHHNHLLARTYLDIYRGDAAGALRRIENQWSNYRRAFLSQVQQIRIDYLQVYCRAALAAAAAASNDEPTLHLAGKLIGRLRREQVAWGTALAEAFEASRLYQSGQAQQAVRQLAQAASSLDRVQMHLFAQACRHHHSHLAGADSGVGSADDLEPAARWKKLGVSRPDRMAAMLVPGFPSSQEQEHAN